ncbi:hypothetical protein J3R80_12890 [Aliiroseovarius sp. Z3]|nr:hypothetical protein [Aliiroseovarius sp. Z3]
MTQPRSVKRKSPRPAHNPRPAHKKVWAIVDGSNVMHWADGEPSVDPLYAVTRRLKKLGFSPRVFFDANAGYLLMGRYLHDRDFENILRLQSSSVTVVPKGTVADEEILREARKLKAIVVTNDRYRDWADRYPEVRKNGFLMRGKYTSNGLVLDVDVKVTA